MVGGTAGALAGGYIGGKVGLAVCAKLKGMGKLVCVLVVGAAGSVETGTQMTEGGEYLGQKIYEYSE
jgi:hypothetical protein